MSASEKKKSQRRIYPLDPRQLSQEELAVAFAMTSRSPDAFDAIAERVTQEKAADFHERWVVNYGHASVAEHAVLHMAVEGVSRLACDALEDNRLASYTEKSSRYQVIEAGDYHVPRELEGHALRDVFTAACDALFDAYTRAVDGLREYLPQEMPRREGEQDKAYYMRLRRVATDNARFLLPAATLSNVGMTINARGMEHAVRKLLSSDLLEMREVGEALKAQGRDITPTLIKYADYNEYLALTYDSQRKQTASMVVDGSSVGKQAPDNVTENGLEAHLAHFDDQAEEKLAAALLYRFADAPYVAVLERVKAMAPDERAGVIEDALRRLGPHDAPLRELETVYYTFDLLMDYGAYREYKRHRMQTYVPQPLTVAHGYVVPSLIARAGLKDDFERAMQISSDAFHKVSQELPQVAEYLVTHAHKRRVLSCMNLRECYHLFKLRTQPTAHFTLREVVSKAMELAQQQHPLLFKYLQLRK